MSPASDSDAKKIEILEKINQIIDLCIDNGSYYTIEEIIPDGALYLGEGKERKNDHKKILEKLKAGPQAGETEKDFILNFSLGRSDYPIREISIPAVFRKKFSKTKILLDGNKPLRPWSCLFWAKIIRAELLRQNRNPWLKLYDHLILYLEANIISCFPEDPSLNKQNFWWKTQFNYLMELTAVSTGEGSLGYAERARVLCENELQGYDERTRAPYDRWIWYNKGIAYQHTRRQWEAVSHFNELTISFFKEYPDSNAHQDIDTMIEFLLNIAPSIMQEAGINIKEQLAYHALKSLDDQRLEDWLKILKERNNSGLIADTVKQVELRRELLKLEALLRLGDLNSSRDKIEKLHTEIKITGTQCLRYDELPQYNNHDEPPTIHEIKLIEQKVIWYREEAIRLRDYIKHKNKCDEFNEKEEVIKNIKEELEKFTCRTNMVEVQYWTWVKDSTHDNVVYFSNWAQFLGIGMKIINLLKGCMIYAKAWDNLLGSVLNLYNKHSKSLPGRGVTQEQDGTERIKLEDLSSDNPFDIISGLSEFYDGMISIRHHLKGEKAKKAIKPYTWTKYYEDLQHDHNRFLNALTEWDKKFGKHQRIEALNRCNERIKWVTYNKADEDCKTCTAFEKCMFPSFKDGKKDNTAGDLLVKDDYELIMDEAEEHFSKHLKDNSSHVPVARSLHFMGLQRWNSLTPAQGRSVGGGYFIYHTDYRGEVDLGIAIDPGFDFIRNLFRQGFSIRDIDIILISHAHPDHLWDFESIVQLLHDLSQKNVDHNSHRINVILTSAAYQRYEHYVIGNPALRQFIEPFVIDLHKGQGHNDMESFSFKENRSEKNVHGRQPHRWKPVLPQSQRVHCINQNIKSQEEVSCEIEEIEIKPTHAYHDDYSRISDSYGMKLKFTFDEESKNLSLGYTGDTKWVSKDLYIEGCPVKTKCPGTNCGILCPENIAYQYHDCEVLLMHLGSLIDHKKHNRFDYYTGAKECEKLIREKNHLYLMGMIRFLKALNDNIDTPVNNKKLILMSEFGEELQGGIRVDVVRRLEKRMNSKLWQILPVDVGLDILLRTEKKTKGKEQPNETKEHEFICIICNKPQPLKNIKYECYGYDEAIFYLCRTCLNARPWDVRQDRMRQLYETGRELKVLPEQKKLNEQAQRNSKVH